MSYFRILRNGTPRSEAAPGTNRSRAGTANQKPQSHCVAKLSEEVRNYKPCESRVAQHYVTSSSRGAKKGASWRCLLLESRATRQLHSEAPHFKKRKEKIISIKDQKS